MPNLPFSLQVSVGQNGHRLVVESRDYDLIEGVDFFSWFHSSPNAFSISEFLLPQPLDARLHLLAIERSPSVGTASTAGSSNLLVQCSLSAYANLPFPS